MADHRHLIFCAAGGQASAVRNVEFEDTTIRGAGEYGIFVYDGAVGGISLLRTVITGAHKGDISNQSKFEIVTR